MARGHGLKIKPQEPPPPMDEGWWQAVLSENGVDVPTEKERETNTTHLNYGWEKLGTSEMDTASNDWEAIQALYDSDQVIQLRVVGYNRGGLLVSGKGVNGFVPISHLIEIPCKFTESEIANLLESYLDDTLLLKVIECDAGRGRVVFSERAARTAPGKRKELLERLKPGDCARGVVTNLTDFGAFIDLGGVEGLIHVSEISWGRVQHPSEQLQIGQEVEVYVLSVNREKARVALSMKRLQPNPWASAEEQYTPGQVVEVQITSIMPYGAFARLEEGLDGLIHISEFPLVDEQQSLRDFIKEGDRVRAKVLHVDAKSQRLGLSLNLDNP